MNIRQITENKKQYLDLLLLGDEQESMIDRYLDKGDMFVLFDEGVKSVCVVVQLDQETCEMKNIATDPRHQRKGYGKTLIEFTFEHYKNQCKTMFVGTGESPKIITFYESLGFRRSHVVKNFFTENYDHPIFEDGIQLVDMIYLQKDFENPMNTESKTMFVDFNKMADYYDAMYVDSVGYENECAQVVDLVRQFGKTDGNSLLDIACGTGEQAKILASHFEVVGLDLSEGMVEIARKKVPETEFHVADMCDFDLGRQFDVAVNLYGSIGFAENFERMKAAVKITYQHLKSGGVFILTPWSTRETFQEGIFSTADNRDGICFCRMEVIQRLAEGKVRVEMHHLIGRNLEVRSCKHEQTITLFSESEYVSALESAGFEIVERLDADRFRMGAFVCTKTLNAK